MDKNIKKSINNIEHECSKLNYLNKNCLNNLNNSNNNLIEKINYLNQLADEIKKNTNAIKETWEDGKP